MNLLEMIERLRNSLCEITVKGKSNLDLLLGSIIAIEQIEAVVSEIINERNKPINSDEDGDKDGRQTDIGLDESNTDK